MKKAIFLFKMLRTILIRIRKTCFIWQKIVDFCACSQTWKIIYMACLLQAWACASTLIQCFTVSSNHVYKGTVPNTSSLHVSYVRCIWLCQVQWRHSAIKRHSHARISHCNQRCQFSRNFWKSRFFYKIQKSLDFLKCSKMSGKVQKISRKKKKFQKKIIGNCFHHKGFFQCRISIANIVLVPATLNGPSPHRAHEKTKHVCIWVCVWVWYQIGHWIKVYGRIYNNLYGRFTDYLPYFSKI